MKIIQILSHNGKMFGLSDAGDIFESVDGNFWQKWEHVFHAHPTEDEVG